jgi:hypothetical protein
VQGLHDLKQGPDRIHAEHRLGLARLRRLAVSICPCARQGHRDPFQRTHDQLALTRLQDLEGLSL